jgi:hypothetical protein
MKLFTKQIDNQLFAQYPLGADLSKQKVVAKIFNPYGRGTWYLINSDPSDPDYLWAIVDLFEVEVGSVSRMELETIKVPPFRLGLERDMSFTPKNAQEVYDGLLEGKRFEQGGSLEDENKQMVLNQAEGFEHHAEELEEAAKKADHVPAWVVAQSAVASSKLSDITHYLDGENEQKREMKEGEEYADGGMLNRELNLKVKEMAQKKGLTPQKLGSDYETTMAQAVVSALGDANFHSEAKKLVVLLEGEDKWNDELYKSVYYNGEDEVDEFGRRVANEAKWDGTDIAEAFKYILKMNGSIKLVKYIDKAMDEMADGGMMEFGGMLIHGFNKGDAILEIYKGYGIVENNNNGVIEVLNPNKGTRFIIDLDDSKSGGMRKSMGMSKENQIKSAKEYIDYLNNPLPDTLLEKFKAEGKMDMGGYMADGGSISSPNLKFMKWYVEWLKDVKEYVNVFISIPNELSSPIQDGKGKIVILDVIEKKGDADAKKYMNQILEKADELGVSIYLQPIPRVYNLKSEEHKKKITKDYLINYYEKLGFKNMVGGFMVREPKMAYGGYMAKGGQISGTFKFIVYKTEGNNFISTQLKGVSPNDVMIKGVEGKLKGNDYNSAENVAYVILDEHDYIDRVEIIKVGASVLKNKKVAAINRDKEDKNRFSIDYYAAGGMMAKGGVTFKEKVKSVKSTLLKGKKVSPKVQKDYGKTYSPKEAEESAKRIVGAMTAKERLMKSMKKGKK